MYEKSVFMIKSDQLIEKSRKFPKLPAVSSLERSPWIKNMNVFNTRVVDYFNKTDVNFKSGHA